MRFVVAHKWVRRPLNYVNRLSVVSILCQLWPFIRPERRRIGGSALITLALTGTEVATPILVGMFIDALLADLAGTATLTAPRLSQNWIVALLALGALVRGSLLSRQEALAGRIGEQVAARIRNAVWNQLQRLPIDYTRRRGSGRILVRFISDTRAIQRLVTNGLVRLSQDLVLAVTILVVLAVLNLRLGAVVALILPVYAALFWWRNPQLRKESRAARRRRSRLSAYLQERIAGMAIVKAYVRQSVEADQIKTLNRQLAKRRSRRAAISGQLMGLTAMTVAANTALVLLLAADEAAAGRLTAGTLVSFYALMGLLVPIFQRIVQANRYYQEAHISVDRLSTMLAERPENPNDDNLPALVVRSGEIVVQNVSYSYAAGRPVLSDIDLVARRGEVIAFVGPNGAGKSTLLELLLRFRQPTSGQILIDGQDIAAVSLASLRSQIGLVAQEAPLFDATVAENIAYGLSDDPPWERIEDAARLAGVTDFVAQLPDGWDTRVGGGGNALSGGQRQRIALARALALDPPILVLDEATSALDVETEQALALTLHKLAQHKTVLVAAHRLPTLRLANRIYVLEHGRIVEAGSHEALLARGGVYTRLFGGTVLGRMWRA